MYEREKELLKSFSKLSGPSSSETLVQKYFHKVISCYVTSIKEDSIGNVIAFRRGDINRKVMIVSHSDEIGLIINYISDSGLIHFTKVGGIDTSVLPGSRVVITHNHQAVSGVIGTNKGCKSDSGYDCKDLWVDIGATSKEDALNYVSVGDYISFAPEYTELYNHCLSAKALDDRAGLVVMCEVARLLYNEKGLPDVYFVSSTQEEIGSRGVLAALYEIQPELCITVDVTFATDYPGLDKKERGDIVLSHGVVIPFGADVTNNIQNLLRKKAEDLHLPYQLEANGKTSCTDASKVQISRAGHLSGLLSIPCRYMHSPNEVISLKDLDGLISLLLEFIKDIR